MSKENFDAILLAAGESLRYGKNISKVFLPFNKSSVIETCVHVISSHPKCSSLIIIINKKDKNKLKKINNHNLKIVVGGKTRSESVKIGIETLEKSKNNHTRILIHDAARPGINHSIIDHLLKNLNQENFGVVPGIPSYDSLAYKQQLKSISIKRDNCFRIQTPQVFNSKILIDLFKNNFLKLNDEAELLRKNNYNVLIVEGDEKLLKITTSFDYETLLNIFKIKITTKVGNGFDVHSFSKKKGVLILCGTEIPFHKTLLGHSDSDVALHALTDGILGTISAGDIGTHFPPGEKKWENTESSVFLKKSLDLLYSKGGSITNIDLTYICEEPKISLYKNKMINTISKLCSINKHHISIKATTTEGLGFLGRKEGIAVLATVTVTVPFE